MVEAYAPLPDQGHYSQQDFGEPEWQACKLKVLLSHCKQEESQEGVCGRHLEMGIFQIYTDETVARVKCLLDVKQHFHLEFFFFDKSI